MLEDEDEEDRLGCERWWWLEECAPAVESADLLEESAEWGELGCPCFDWWFWDEFDAIASKNIQLAQELFLSITEPVIYCKQINSD